MSGSKSSLSAVATGQSDRPRRNLAEKHLRLPDLVVDNAIRPDDVLRCHKRYKAGENLEILVDDARVVISAEPQTKLLRTVKVEMLEDGRRSPLGSFTGPGGILEALVCRAGGLPTGTHVHVPRAAWEEFEIFRNGISLGTAAHVRQQYHAGHQIGEHQPVMTVAGPANSTDAANGTNAANVTPAVFQTPDQNESTHNIRRSASPQISFGSNNSKISEPSTPPGQLNLTASTALAMMDSTSSTTSPSPMQPPQTTMAPRTTTPSPMQPPQTTMATRPTFSAPMQPPTTIVTQTAPGNLAKKRKAKKNNDNSDQELQQDSVMQELYAELPRAFRPGSYNQKDTAIAAKECINWQYNRLFEVYQLILLMGATPESLADMRHKLDEGGSPGDAIWQCLKWGEKGPRVPEEMEDDEDEDDEDGGEAEGAEEDAGAKPADK